MRRLYVVIEEDTSSHQAQVMKSLINVPIVLNGYSEMLMYVNIVVI